MNESGSAWVTAIFDPLSAAEVYVSRICGAEVVSAIARRGRKGDISQGDAANAIARFRSEFPAGFRTIEITAILIDRAIVAAETYALRGYDAVQLATALELSALRSAGARQIFACHLLRAIPQRSWGIGSYTAY